MVYTFGKLFTYSTCAIQYWGRKYYGCTLLKDCDPYYKGDHVGIIDIDYLLGHMWLSHETSAQLAYCVCIKFKKYTTQSIIDACKWSYTGLDDILDRLGLPLPEGDFLRMLDSLYEHLQKDYWEAAALIQKQFKESISNPAFRLCRNRLRREFEESACITRAEE